MTDDSLMPPPLERLLAALLELPPLLPLPGLVSPHEGVDGAAQLVLDPAMAPIPLVPWNAMLTGWASKQPRRAVATLSERVNIDAVLVLSPVVQAQEGE